MAGGAAGGFLSRAFESMLKECSFTKKSPDLQKAIQTFQDNCKTPDAAPPQDESSGEIESAGSVNAVLSSAGNTLEGPQAELVLNPLRLAFETKNLKLIEPALDCLHKLIAYDHLEGDPGLEGGKNVPLFTDILNMICNCVDNSSPDSTVLQVLKVLLTAVASAKFRVHGEPLLGVIRVCYNIALNSKSPVNQATSKAMLTQMISIIFRRMETDPIADTAGESDAASTQNSNTEVEGTSSGDLDEKGVTLGEALNQAKDSSLASVEELHNLAGGADIKGLEAVLDKAVHLEDGKKITRGIDLESMSIGQRDALLVFRTLCKMGMKEDNDEVTTKTRILSLELLQGLLEGVSHSFTKNFHFIDSVKAYLSYALLRASVSQSPVIFQYATGIFSVLLLRFRESLKGEIGVFFPLIVLRSLDGLECPVNQKLSVLRMLEKVCKDPQMLVDIFVNYDCDLEAPNLFERMVTTLSRISQGAQNADPNSVAVSQTTSIKGSSLQCLVNVLKSLVDWEKSHRESGKQTKGSQSPEEKVSVKEGLEIKSREDITSNFEKAKAHKSTMEAAISEFNRKPVKAIEYLISNKLVENTPASVAQFLRNTHSLDKAMIGDYLGQHEDFPLAVMHAYVDSMKFSGMKFDVAIREFLKGFRLPGEAQKIDRIMEKFAERYCADNPDLFKNADTAYVLAYAVILLNTDAHNPMVWPKMSKSDFIRMNAVNDAEECAPTELLEEIYNSIVKEEIKMKDDSVGIEKSSRQKPEGEERGRLVGILNLALPRSKSLTDTKSESEAIIKQTQAIFRSQGAKRGVFYTPQQIELVRPMVEAVGWPLLATFSVTMEEGENKPRVVLCMEGFKAGIHITHVLGMDTMRYAFLTSLAPLAFSQIKSFTLSLSLSLSLSAMDDLPIEKIAISGPTLASLIQRFSTSPGPIDGLLYGHVSLLTPSTLSDDTSSSSSSLPSTSTSLPPISSSSQTLIATITSFLSLSAGHVNPRLLPPPPPSSSLIGWFSARRRSPLRPSLREFSLSHSLSSLPSLSFPILSSRSSLSPCIFLLLSSPIHDQTIHTHEYRAYQFRSSLLSFDPKSIEVINIGPAFRSHYGAFSPNSPFPSLPCGHSSSMAVDDEKEEEERLRAEQTQLDDCAEGFQVGRLSKLMGNEAANYSAGLEDLYGKMLVKIETLARQVEQSSALVFEQENHNRKLKYKAARFTGSE